MLALTCERIVGSQLDSTHSSSVTFEGSTYIPMCISLASLALATEQPFPVLADRLSRSSDGRAHGDSRTQIGAATLRRRASAAVFIRAS